jgi:hypothetical protein
VGQRHPPPHVSRMSLHHEHAKKISSKVPGAKRPPCDRTLSTIPCKNTHIQGRHKDEHGSVGTPSACAPVPTRPVRQEGDHLFFSTCAVGRVQLPIWRLEVQLKQANKPCKGCGLPCQVGARHCDMGGHERYRSRRVDEQVQRLWSATLRFTVAPSSDYTSDGCRIAETADKAALLCLLHQRLQKGTQEEPSRQRSNRQYRSKQTKHGGAN